MTERTVAIVQARMGSTRFPGKMTAPFLGRPILSWVIKRLQRCQHLDDIILATTTHKRDHVLMDMGRDHGIKVFAGDEQNVLKRFVEAADHAAADTVVRVCADNPLIAPEAVDQLIEFYKERHPDYAYNHVPKGDCIHPDGFGAEMLSKALLKNILALSSKPEHYEHVTSYLWAHQNEFDMRAPHCPAAWQIEKGPRFDVDHPEDLGLLEQTLSIINVESTIEDVLNTWLKVQKYAQAE